MRTLALALLPALLLAGPAAALDFESAFAGLDGCFLLVDATTGKELQRYGGRSCAKRLAACSTFKVALAAMAYDAGVLKDESDLERWDGKPHEIEPWNQDHGAASWMKDSVVWYSQRLTPKLGRKKLAYYLKRFGYGNRDLSGGLEGAWLALPGYQATLRLSVDEQAAFLRRLWSGKLKLSAHALEKTKAITRLEQTPRGYTLYGKTGSGFVGKKGELRLGWFVAVLERGDERLVSIVRFVDREANPTAPKWAGRQARELTQRLLASANYW